MKTLTIKQPWASLIIEGYKEYEFRTWKTNFRGKIYIHAGKTLENSFLKDLYDLKYLRGAIIGEAELEDCILVSEEFNKFLKNKDPNIYGNNHVDFYAWKLKNILKYEQPIYTKGMLGLWNYKEK